MKVTHHLSIFVFPRVLVRVTCWLLLLAMFVMVLAACNNGAPATDAGAVVAAPAGGGTDETPADATPQAAAPGAAEVLPGLEPLTLAEGDKLNVVATTSLVADVALHVGGDAITLTTLIPIGADPHSYTPTDDDIKTLNDADLILTNGLGLEEGLTAALGDLKNPVPVVSINAGLTPLSYEEGTPAATDTAKENTDNPTAQPAPMLDPHTWLSVSNVEVWVDNVAALFAMLDAAHVDSYFSNAGAYHDELDALDAELRQQIDTLPEDQRKLVTDHLEFNYFAQDYGFQVVGTVIPGISTTATSSDEDLAELKDAIQAAGVKTIFAGTNVDQSLVNQVAEEMGLKVVPLYTSSLSEADGPAPDYPALMRYDVNAIVTALAQ
jgi:ABC-type Zn uptake system ZnuABC Zn-binding protein ZnuA